MKTHVLRHDHSCRYGSRSVQLLVNVCPVNSLRAACMNVVCYKQPRPFRFVLLILNASTERRLELRSAHELWPIEPHLVIDR